MPLTEELQAGQMVTNRGYAVRLSSFVSSIGENDYWWCTTLFTDNPEPVMLAFKHHTAIQQLHTKTA